MPGLSSGFPRNEPLPPWVEPSTRKCVCAGGLGLLMVGQCPAPPMEMAFPGTSPVLREAVSPAGSKNKVTQGHGSSPAPWEGWRGGAKRCCLGSIASQNQHLLEFPAPKTFCLWSPSLKGWGWR